MFTEKLEKKLAKCSPPPHCFCHWQTRSVSKGFPESPTTLMLLGHSNPRGCVQSLAHYDC